MEPPLYIPGRSIRSARKHREVLLARIICSDPSCPEEIEVAVESLDDLDGFVCECGFGFVLAQVAELRETSGAVISLPRRGPARSRRAA